MKSVSRVAFGLCTLVVLAGCASTKVTGGHNYQGERLARPDRIIVHDFAATPSDIPAWSDAASQYAEPSTPQTAEVIETGRELGAQVAKELVAEIQSMGLPAVHSGGQPAPNVGDIVIIGYFASIDEGSAVKRVAIGFGSGGAELKTEVEGYLMTDQGLHEIGSREIDSGAGKTPGVMVPLAVTIATANPIGLIVGGALKVTGEVTGSSKVTGSAKRTAKKIGDELRVAFEKQGWL
jgi:hypothetical protein